MTDVAAWYQTMTQAQRHERFGYLPWWVVFGPPHDPRPALASASPRIEDRPGFLVSKETDTIEGLCWALDQQDRTLSTWCCVYTREGWRFVFSNQVDAMTARLLL